MRTGAIWACAQLYGLPSFLGACFTWIKKEKESEKESLDCKTGAWVVLSPLPCACQVHLAIPPGVGSVYTAGDERFQLD